MTTLAWFSVLAGILALLCMVFLHFTSPEFDPSWRMISEYAYGKSTWLITTFFILWGLSSISLAVVLFKSVHGLWALIGVLLLFISGIGEIMGGLYDVKHKLHGMSFMLGVPTLPIAALILGYYLVKSDGWKNFKPAIIYISHAPWISLVLMAIAMGVMFAGFKKAGMPMGPDTAPPDKVPDGVIALGGYANRILVFCYLLWVIYIAKSYTGIQQS